MTRARVLAILDGTDPVVGRRVAFAIQALILFSVVAIGIDTLPNLPTWLDRFLAVEEWVVVAIFTAEYVTRLVCSPRPLRYATSFLGIVDLLAILPTLLFVGTDLRSLRALRALRALQLLKLMRYVHALERLRLSLVAVADELVVFAGIALVILYLCATGIYFFENEAQPEAFASIFHSMWWAVVTLTTVGYGDVYPVTAGGRIFTGLILLVALGIIAVPTGLIASALSREPPAPPADPPPADHRG